MLFESGIFIFDNEILFIKEHFYFHIIFLMAIFNIANSFSIIMLLSDMEINEKELPKILDGIIDSFKLVYTFFACFVLFFVVAKYIMATSSIFGYYSNTFIVVVMLVLFLETLFKTLVNVEKRLEKSISIMNEEYKDLIKKNLDSMEMFKKIGTINDLIFKKVDINDCSVRYVVEEIKKLGSYEQIFLVRYSDDDNILSAYFDKKGNLLAEDARKKEK
jgi:hypothetical protein